MYVKQNGIQCMMQVEQLEVDPFRYRCRILSNASQTSTIQEKLYHICIKRQVFYESLYCIMGARTKQQRLAGRTYSVRGATFTDGSH